MSKFKVIGLVGVSGSGKSVVARHLQDSNSHPRVYRARLAGPIKTMLRAMGLSRDDVDGLNKELVHPLLQGNSPRYAMQTLGTEWGRDTIGKNIWIDILFHSLENGRSVDVAIIDDVRFPNEILAIKDRGGVIWRIDRPNNEKNMLDLIEGVHESEFYADKFKANTTLVNNKGLIELKVQAQNAFIMQLGKWERGIKK